jgi:hypothetical protein
LTLFWDGNVAGPSIVGFKSAAAYTQILRERLADSSKYGTPGNPRVVWATPMASKIGFFFRHVPGRRLLAFDSAGSNYLMDLDTRHSWEAPGELDLIASPSGLVFVTPGPERAGLDFFDVEAVVQGARRRDLPAALFRDPFMRDQYPSVANLAGSGDSISILRVLTSWFTDVSVRDYVVRASSGRVTSVAPVGPPWRPCDGLNLSLPMLSPDGTMIAGRDGRTGTTKVWRIMPFGHCTAVRDIGQPTSKATFNPPSTSIAYSRQLGSNTSGVFVFDLAASSERLIATVHNSALTIPDYLSVDSVVFLAGSSTGPDTLMIAIASRPNE